MPRLRAAYDEALARYDVLVMPTLPLRATQLPGPDAPREEVIPRALEMIANTCVTDVTGHPVVPARVDFVTSTQRRTTLGGGEVAITLVEHLLATLAGLRVDNCVIELDGPEPPGLDGSARGFVDVVNGAADGLEGKLDSLLSRLDSILVDAETEQQQGGGGGGGRVAHQS